MRERELDSGKSLNFPVIEANKAAPMPKTSSGTADFRSEYLIELFSRMAKTYGAVNLISSFGFSHLWRKACVDALEVEPGHCCADLMAGMAESSVIMARRTRGALTIHAVDFCPTMSAKAHEVAQHLKLPGIQVQTADVLGLPGDEVYDRICATFGLKTLDENKQMLFATVLHRLLKPGGRFSLVEIYVPSGAILKWPFLFYLRYVIPLVGRFFLDDPDCYRSLAIYAEDFAQRNQMGEHLARAGFKVESRLLFFGCAKLFVGERSM